VTDLRRDPVCGMLVDPKTGLTAEFRGVTYCFDSEFCRNAFLADPEHLLDDPIPPEPEEDPTTWRIAYFSMEVGADPRLPTYSGGLGVLAGDTLRSLADQRVPAVSGVDLWLNTPLRPLEASGTSGMKAAHNGVPSLSVLDGWWVEGHMEGLTGWSIGEETSPEDVETPEIDARDAAELYQKLGDVILPLYYRNPEEWIRIMQQTIAFNASFFNPHRMVQQYAARAYA
jgi:glucan phosphorylase/YHS domain-containing protein